MADEVEGGWLPAYCVVASADAVRNHSQSLGVLMPEERLHYQRQ